MKRIVDYYLLEWKNRKTNKPLLLRGARQVGKTYAARTLGKTFTHFVEVNLEEDSVARAIFEKDLDVNRIKMQLVAHTRTPIIAGETLLFIDEMQASPQAILALRYFYEKFPGLHVIGAGSLLEFAIAKVGLPVGRITMLYMYPLSFLEFLAALGYEEWVQLIITKNSQLFEELHHKIIDLVGIYLAVGGLPEAVAAWVEEQSSRSVRIAQEDITATYIEDFDKYGRRHQIKYLNTVFESGLKQLSKKFMYSRLGEYQKRELEPALDLLVRAGLMYKVYQTSGQGIPLGADAKLDAFKVIFLDIGLCQALLDYDISSWLIDPLSAFHNKGELVEAFVGQELLAYSDPIKKENLYYWVRAEHSAQAEIDYLVQIEGKIIPIEVKSGKSLHLRSMHAFLQYHKNTPYGIRIWSNNRHIEENLHSYPLYGVSIPILNSKSIVKEALLHLIG